MAFLISGRSNDSEVVIIQPAAVENTVTADVEIAEPDIEQVPDPTQTEIVEMQILPTPRPGLEGTDPATVNLANGEIQLVEVFAFW